VAISNPAMRGVLGGQLSGWAIVQGATQARGMKVRASVKKLCDGCKVCFCGFLSTLDFLGWLQIGPGLGLVRGEHVDNVTMLVWLGFLLMEVICLVGTKEGE
jgi:Ribosomal protein L36